MTDLRNPDIRTRDIRKLIGWKFQSLVWERKDGSSSEWVFTSTETEKDRTKLVSWLKSKNIQPSCECIMVDSSWAKPERVLWLKIIESPELYFKKSEFQVYDLDLTWSLEYKSQEISRFGKFCGKQNA